LTPPGRRNASAGPTRNSREAEKNLLAEVQAGIDGWRRQQRERLVAERMAALKMQLEAAQQQLRVLSAAADAESDKLAQLKRRREAHGGQLIEDLQRQLDDAERERPERLRKREIARAACETMGWTLPDEVLGFVQRVEAAREQVRRAGDRGSGLEARMDAVKHRKLDAEREFEATVREVRAMERQRSNIPARLLDLRERMARELGLMPERLPFVGELLQVRADQAPWQGAIERVLGGFARSVLVAERDYAAVTSWLEGNDTGERLFYNRMLAQQAGTRSASPNALSRKVEVAPDADRAVADWLREELKAHHDFECTDSLQAFRAAQRAVTKAGQIKRDSTRHEKNDRQRIDDRTQWVLGFDNCDKLALYQRRAADLGQAIGEADRELAVLRDEAQRERRRDDACIAMQNLSWNDVDVNALVALAADLRARIEGERGSRPELQALERWIGEQQRVSRRATDARNDCDANARSLQREIADLGKALQGSSTTPHVELTPSQTDGIAARVPPDKPLALDNLDEFARHVDRGLSKDLSALDVRIAELRGAIEQRFAEFNRLWPAEAGGMTRRWPQRPTTSPNSRACAPMACRATSSAFCNCCRSRATRT
jgi:uncharacterized protein YPO0396